MLHGVVHKNNTLMRNIFTQKWPSFSSSPSSSLLIFLFDIPCMQLLHESNQLKIFYKFPIAGIALIYPDLSDQN